MNIRSLFQDSKGRIWISCQDGLWIYDGKEFYNFSIKDGFEVCDVGSVCEDNEGAMWIGSSDGICIYKNKKFVYLDTVGNKLPRWISWSMFKDTDGTIWAGSHFGLYHFDPKKLKDPLIKKYSFGKDRLNNLIRLVKRKADGTLIAGAENAYFIMKGDTFVKEENLTGPVYNLVEFDNGKEWYSGWGSPVRQVRNHVNDSVIDVSSGVLHLTKDRKGNVWFSTFDKGIFKYNGIEVINYSSKEGLTYNSFWTSLTDREGNVWFGSFGNGLYKYSGDVIVSINSKNGLFNDVLINIKQDTIGNVWMLTQNAIMCYDKTLLSVKSYTSFEGVPLSSLTRLEITPTNEVLAFGYGGHGYKITSDKMVKEAWIGGFGSLIGDSGALYICGEDKIFKRSTNGVTTTIHSKRKGFPASWSIDRDETGRIWLFNVFSGLTLYNGYEAFYFSSKNGYMRTPANCVYSNSKDTVWIGTKGRGVFKYKFVNDSTLRILDSLTTSNGLQSNFINSLHVYNGKMYIGTSFGMGVMNMANYLKGEKRIKMFTAEEGLVNSSCSVNFIDKDGKLWIATQKGAFVFDTRSQMNNDIEPCTYITNVQLNHKDVDWVQVGYSPDKNDLPVDLKLSYDQNYLSFKFIGISHTSPTKILYQYKLEGIDKDWSPPTKESEITYPTIPPGKYKFMVRSCNSDGVWNKTPTEFSFVITPPFWRTQWFTCIIIILGAAGVWLTMRYREQKLRKEKQILENKVNDRTSELKEALLQVEEKQKEIIDSLNYAKRLQKAILASEKTLRSVFEQSFILFKPKDIVSGDFYWMVHLEEKKIGKNIFVFAAADCTGHGVPGAFMSMLNSTLLNQTVYNPNIMTPADVLNFMNKELPKNLRTSDDNEKIQDGMDIAFGIIDINKNILKFCGANNPCWIIRDSVLIELEPIKQAITATTEYEKKIFVDQEIQLKKGDCIYMFTDGYADQFGGPKGKKYKYKTLANHLLALHNETMQKQKQALEETFESWKGKLEQVDDVCVIGIRIL